VLVSSGASLCLPATSIVTITRYSIMYTLLLIMRVRAYGIAVYKSFDAHLSA